MAEETFAEATMRKIRELQAENAAKDRRIRQLEDQVRRLEREAEDPWRPMRYPRIQKTWLQVCEAPGGHTR